MSKLLDPTQQSNLTTIQDELFRILDRAKYYGDPITADAIDSLYRDLNTWADSLDSSAGVECEACTTRILNEHVCMLPSLDKIEAFEAEIKRLNQTVSDLESELGV